MKKELRIPGTISKVINGKEEILLPISAERPEDYAKRIRIFLSIPHHGGEGTGKSRALMVRWDGTVTTAGYITEQSTTTPPRLAQFILLLIPLRQREHLIGDLEEEFETIVVPKYGLKLARLYYAWQVLVETLRTITNSLRGVLLGWLLSRFKI